jgi:NitT/TauT family transport system permease protein
MVEVAHLSRGLVPWPGRLAWLRVALVALVAAAWEVVARSGLLYRDVVPSLLAIMQALAVVLATPSFYGHLAVTAGEVAASLVLGGGFGIAIGLALGVSRFLSQAFEHFLYWLGPTPKIILFPILIMWCGVGPASKIGMGAISAFFPIVLSVASGLRAIDPVLVRVGRSFNAGWWQMVAKIYLPAMRVPILNGIRLGFGVALIGTLLAETKLSNAGIGFLVMNAYSLFNMPAMYAMLIVLFTLAIAVNELLGTLIGPRALVAPSKNANRQRGSP